MPSPFPGMDPFIEGQEWEDFHHGIIADIQEALMPSLRPRYVVRVEKRVYVEDSPEAPQIVIRPDVSVLEEHTGEPLQTRGGTAVATAIAPVVLTLPISERRRVAFLTIRERETREVVTVIEVLSPINKHPRGGRPRYLRKRDAVLHSAAHLVEIDLLRGGRRLPTIEPLPPGDYYALIAREQERPRAEVYVWTLRQPLPTLPIPLAEGDPDVSLDLQAVFTLAYDRAGYDYSLDYRLPVEPPLVEADAAWAQEILEGR